MIPPCPYDPRHAPIFRFGFQGGRQMWLCNICRRKFSAFDNYFGSQYSRQFVIEALTYYFNGTSYGNLSQALQDLHGQSIGKVTLWRWVVRYSNLVRRWALSLRPQLGGVWVADETVIKVGGTDWWFWDLIDYETRYLVATHFSKTRGMNKAAKLFTRALHAAKQPPRLVITDKLKDYRQAFGLVFGASGAVHVTSKGFDGPINTNLIERFQGTIKQRTKVMRHFKDPESAGIVLDGLICHYNFLWERKHLDNQTPAMRAKVSQGAQHWGDLIDFAMQYQMAIGNVSQNPAFVPAPLVEMW